MMQFIFSCICEMKVQAQLTNHTSAGLSFINGSSQDIKTTEVRMAQGYIYKLDAPVRPSETNNQKY